MGYRLGVDLGMTYTSAAVDVDGRVEMLGLGIRAMQVPSVVFVRENGEIVVGEAAEQLGAADPDRLVREFKRRLGDPVPLVIGGSPYSAQALTARLLAWVVQRATERQGARPDHVCLTHPANWGPFKRDLLAQAVELAGLDRARTSLCSEPEAAAIAYAARDRVVDGDRLAVYDLGGGTFDAAVLVRRGAEFRLAGPPTGVEHLGGVDFDEAVFQHALDALEDVELDDTDPATLAGLARLRRDCVEAKEVLSAHVDTVIPVSLPGVTRSVRLTRGELDEMLRPAVGETVEAMRRALEAARTAPADLSAILMVGGSSRIPLVSQLVSAAFERPLAMDNHPKHDIALGAAQRGTAAAGAGSEDRTSVVRQPPPGFRAGAGAGSAGAAAGPPPVDARPPVSRPIPVVGPPTPNPVAGPSGTHLPVPGRYRPNGSGSAAPAPGRPPARPSGPPPPPPPPPGPGAPAARRRRRWLPAVLGVAVLAALGVTSVFVAPTLLAQEVYRESVVSPGAFPGFVMSDDPGTATTSMGVDNPAAVAGDTPGLYGGTETNTCDPAGIRDALAADPAKAQAWASGVGIPVADIGSFLATLTPLTLRTDTAVTNHGFENGRPTPFQSVLQAGTAVLVDPQGLPRVRCYCGNPLAEPNRGSNVRYTDDGWTGFSEDDVTVITRSPAEIRDFVVVMPGTDQVVMRPRGTTGDRDQPADRAMTEKVDSIFSPVETGATGPDENVVGDPEQSVEPEPVDPSTEPLPVDPETDPGTVDPGTDPGTVDPGTVDPGTVDPGTTDPGTTGPGTDPGSTGPGAVGPGSSAPLNPVPPVRIPVPRTSAPAVVNPGG